MSNLKSEVTFIVLYFFAISFAFFFVLLTTVISFILSNLRKYIIASAAPPAPKIITGLFLFHFFFSNPFLKPTMSVLNPFNLLLLQISVLTALIFLAFTSIKSNCLIIFFLYGMLYLVLKN